jgi:large subunit ribosomal protein L3
MTQVFSDTGELLPVTVLEAGPCIVVARRTTAKEGYEAVQLGFGDVKEKQLRQPAAGHFKKAGVAARRHLRELRLRGDSDLVVGQELKVDIFKAGDRVDVTGTSRGKGFSGQHKRHHFGRGPVTHGSHNIKQPGSIGSSSTPSRVYKGMRMAGQMGNATATSTFLTVVRVDLDRNLMLVRGAVPGHPNSLLLVRDARQRGKPKK